MELLKKHTGFSNNDYLKIFHSSLKSIIAHIPILAVAINGWQLASHGFTCERCLRYL